MLNTPKPPPKLAYTRSEKLLHEKSEKRQAKSMCKSDIRNWSKTQQLNYQMILKKLLSIQTLPKFLQYSSKFIDSILLQCKQQPNRFSSTLFASKSNMFLTDGLFIKKYAQLSERPIQIITFFLPHVKFNRGVLSGYYRKLTIGVSEAYDRNQVKLSQQTDQEKEKRYQGYYKSKEGDREQKKQIKIVYSEYIKSNRKSMQIYQKVKRKMMSEKQHPGFEQLSWLKRNQIQEKDKILPFSIHQHKRSMFRLNSNDCKLYENQKPLLQYFPKLKFLVVGPENVRNCMIVAVLGRINNFIVNKVLLQFHQCCSIDIFEHAVTLQIATDGDLNSLLNEKEVEKDNCIRYLYRKQNLAGTDHINCIS